MFKSVFKNLKPEPVSLITFLFCALGAINSHIMIFASFPERDIRLWKNLSLGAAYDVMNAAMPAAVCLLLCWRLRPVFKAAVHGTVVFIYLVFIFIDYIYVLQLGSHLPFSTIEYLESVGNFEATIASALSGKSFWILLAAPALLYFAILGAVFGLSAKKPVSIGSVLASFFFLAIAGGAAGSYANSYLSKNLNDPLSSSAALYFYWSRNIEKDQIIDKPQKALKIVTERIKGEINPAPEYRDFPLVRTVSPSSGPENRNSAGEALRAVERPNIILIMLESFRAAEIGVHGSPIKITPNFDRLSKEGVWFKNFYANGFQTRNGQAASYCSIASNYGAAVMKAYARNNYLCLPQILKKLGYSTSWIFGSDAAFDDQIHFLPKIGIDTIYDKFSFDSKAEVLGWGYSDEEMYKKWLEILDKEKEPFFSSALTITNHHPFDVPDKYKLNIVKGELNKYYESFYYTDAMLGKFIEEARNRKWHADALIFVMADTANYQIPQKNPENFEEFVKIRSHIPLLILGGAVRKPAVIEDYFSQIDLPPTIMDLLGTEYTAPWMGISIISANSSGTAFTVRPGNYFAVMSLEGRYYNENNSIDHYHGFREQASAERHKTLGLSMIKATKWLLQQNLIWPGASKTTGY